MTGQTDQVDVPAIAIVGISARFPGAASKDEFWRNQRAGRNCLGEVPPERWRWQDVFGAPLRERAKTNSRWGGFLSGLDLFDPMFFGISPYEAELMDPQHRLFLKACWEAIFDAGYSPERFAGSDLGVFVGVQFQEYQQLLLNAGIIRAQVSTGNAKTMLPNRVSFLLDVNGPSVAVDTACSSSLVAIHQAVQAIRRGECSAALVGGANLMLVPDVHIMGSQMGILSPTGQSSCLDAAADGYVRGEGVGALLIKPCRDAERDGDHIYALIRGSAVSHGGHSVSLASPRSDTQAIVMRRALADARREVRDIGYVEMHATGTVVGDPVEVEAVKRVFAEAPADAARQPCALASVKANIGHLEAAAGLAGVINAALAIAHRWLPGMSTFRRQNPQIDLSGTPFYIHHEGGPWVLPRGASRSAIVNSYGFGGALASLVLDEHRTAAGGEARDTDEAQVIPLSVSSEPLVRVYASELKVAVESLWQSDGADASLLERIAYTLQHGRDDRPVRAAIRVSDLAQFLAALRSVKDGVPDARYVATSAEAAMRSGWPEAACTWLAGGVARWSHRPYPVRRVPLPAPPWNDRRCWFSTSPLDRQPAAAPAITAPAAADPAASFVHLEPIWAESPPSIAAAATAAVATEAPCVVVLGDDAGRLDEVKAALDPAVAPRVRTVVTARYATPRSSAGAIAVTESGIAGWLDQLARDGVRPGVVVLLAPHRDDPLDPGDGAQAPIDLVFLLARELMARHLSKPIALWYVAGCAEGTCPRESALEAFAKSVYLENSRFVMNVVYPGEHGAAEAVAEEFRRGRAASPQMVRFDGRRRLTRRLRVCDRREPARARVEIRPGGTYLLPGGGGELGRRLARKLAIDHGANVVLLGRTAAGDASRQMVGEILAGAPRGAGEVDYLRCDVTRLAEVEATVAEVIRRFGGLHGVLSLVTDHRDALLLNKTWDDFQAVSGGKVAGTIHLDLATRAVDLDFFMVFSSQASLGMAGACDYAFGCEFQNQLVAWRDALVARGQRRGRSIAINWSRWQWDRYVTDDFDAWVRALGYEFLDIDTGAGELVRIMGTEAVRIFALYGDRDRIVASLDLETGVLRAEASAQRRRKAPVAAKQDDVDELLARMTEAELAALASKLLPSSASPPPEVRATGTAPASAPGGDGEVGDVLVSVLSRQLKVGDLTAATAFADLGVDSIVAMELVSELEKRLGLEMHPNWLFQYPTVGQLAAQMAAVLRDGGALATEGRA